jgi:hypothetical protein
MPLSGRGPNTAAEGAPVLSNFSGTESQTNRPAPDDVISVRKENSSEVHSHPDYIGTVNGSPSVASDSVKNKESAPESNTSCAHFRRTDYSKWILPIPYERSKNIAMNTFFFFLQLNFSGKFS